jgi:class 3 adenylate cyclase/tRNA A-37 threonylcarbamoyl transferase component Bud32
MSAGPGTSLGRYRIESLIGRGATGTVYEALDERLGRRVALKVLLPELARDPIIRDRFVSESRIVASIDHPHVIPVYDADEVDDHLFIVMRLVPDGRDLDVLLRETGRLDPLRAATIVAQVGEALDAAHAAGLVHRDVKPGNVLIARAGTRDDHAYLCDFGLARSLSAGSATLSGTLHGTVGYMAPEVIEGRKADPRADIYSLGCMLFELLAGEGPYRRETDVAVLFAQVRGETPEVTSIDPALPPAIDEVIRGALAPDPDERIRSAGELGRLALAALAPLEGAPASATRGFLFADLRDYTAFLEERGDDDGARLLERYRAMVRAVIARHSGAEIRTEGDSFYVLFPSVTRAVTAGLEMVAEAERRSVADAAYPIRVGVGVNAGEAAETPEGPVGSAVNLAARICAQAAAGEVLVSDVVRGLLRTRSRLEFEALGTRALKGIAEPVALYRARERASTTPGATTGARGDPAAVVPASSRARLARSPAVLVGGITALAVAALLTTWLVGSMGGGPVEPTARAGDAEPGAGAGVPAATETAEIDDGSPAATATLAPTPAVAVFPTVDERRLLERLPSDVAATCTRASPGAGGSGGTVALVCEPPLGAAVDRAWFDDFEPEEGASSAFFRLISAAGVSPGNCDSGGPGHDRWQVGAGLGGERACYLRDGAAWVAWTNPSTGLMAKATRGDGNLADLVTWWKETAPFVR